MYVIAEVSKSMTTIFENASPLSRYHIASSAIRLPNNPTQLLQAIEQHIPLLDCLFVAGVLCIRPISFDYAIHSINGAIQTPGRYEF